MVYLDNAATSFPKPASVAEAVYGGVAVYGGNPGRGSCPPSRDTFEKIYVCREKINGFFGGYGSECTVFTSNATAALNAAILGTAKKHGYRGHFVITAFEHNSVLRPVEELRALFGMEYTVVNPCLKNDGMLLTRLQNAIREDTVAVIMTHASNLCGRVLPIEETGKMLENSGIAFIVDASQTAGILQIDMKKCCISLLCAPGHKGLLGPTGTGMLLINPDFVPEPIILGGTGSSSASAAQPKTLPEGFEGGTLNTVGILGLEAGLDAVMSRPHRSEEELGLAKRLHSGLKRIPKVILYTDFDLTRFVPTVCFNIGKRPSFEISETLGKMGFATRGGLHCAPLAHRYFNTLEQGAVRASIGFYNTREDIDGFLNAVEVAARQTN